MGVAQLNREPRHYRLPAPALSPLVLPQLNEAMRQAHAALFERDEAGIVDLKAHSMLCREALQSGLLDASAAQWLSLYPNAYGLHRLTQEVVGRIGAAFTLTGDLFPARAQMLARLNSQYADPRETATIALATIDAQLLSVEEVAPYLEEGPDAAGTIMQVIEAALMRAVSLPDDMTDSIRGAIQEGHFFLEAAGFSTFVMGVPAEMEMRVLLFKTLDAMSGYLLPFHTPLTFLGQDCYFNHMVGEAYNEMADRLQHETRDEIRALLLDESAELPSTVEEILYYEERCEYSVDRLLDQLYEMAELNRVSGYRLGDGGRAELQELHDQAAQICERDGTNPLAAVLREALAVCLEHEANPPLNHINLRDLPGTAEESVSLFEAIVVEPNWDLPNLREASFEGFDQMIEGSGFPLMGLPLSGEALKTTTLPVLRELSLTLDLLHRIAKATEERDNAAE